MKASATITSKGQLTLPKAIRERLKLEVGDSVEFVVLDGQAMLVPRNRAASSMFGRLSHRSQPGTQLANYDAAIGEGISDHLDDQASGTEQDAA